MLERLKPLYNGALMPAAKLFIKLRIHPNIITLLGLAISSMAGVYAAIGHWHAAAVWILAGALMDGLDGLVARITNARSDFGGVLDSTCDRLTEIAWLGGICWYYLSAAHDGGENWGAFLAFVAITGSLMVSYVRARCEGADIPCKEGLLQRPERTILLIVCFLAGPAIMHYGLAILSILAYVTIIQRIILAYMTARKMD